MRVAAGWIKWFDQIIIKRLLSGGSKAMLGLAMLALVCLMLITVVDVTCRHTSIRPPWGAGGFEMSEVLMNPVGLFGASMVLVFWWPYTR